MTARGPAPSGRVVQDTRTHVDAAYGGAVENGTFEEPFLLVQDGIDAQAAVGAGVVLVADGAYVEDLAFADGVDVEGGTPGGVLVTGSAVATDVSLTLENLNFIDDGAGDAFQFTGVAADTVRCILCNFDVTATGDQAIVCDNTNAGATLNLEGCTGAADVANANALGRLDSGVLSLRECDFPHANDVLESFELLGTAASTFEARDTTLTGTLAVEVAAVAPAVTLTDVDIVVGAVSAVEIAAGATVTYLSGNVTSADAGDLALDGAGTLAIGEEVHMLGTADGIGVTTVTTAGRALIQHGRISATAAGSPTVTAIALDPDMPSVAYTVTSLVFEATGGAADDVILSVDQGTIATTGFSVVATSAAAGAIAGEIHWEVTHD